MAYNYVFIEQGNGFPQDGDHVIYDDDNDGIVILEVLNSSPIHSKQNQSNYIYLECENTGLDFHDFSEKKQNRVWESYFHVCDLDNW